MLMLNHKDLIQDSILTFNYYYRPLVDLTSEEVEVAAEEIIERLTYYNCLNVEYVLKELIKLMKDNNFNVINHYEEFKPINLVKLLKLLGLDIGTYYN